MYTKKAIYILFMLIVWKSELSAYSINTLEVFFDNQLVAPDLPYCEDGIITYCADQPIQVQVHVVASNNTDANGFTIEVISYATGTPYLMFTNIRAGFFSCLYDFEIEPGEIPNGEYYIKASCSFTGYPGVIHDAETCPIDITTVVCGLVEDALNWSAPKSRSNTSIATAEYKIYFVGDNRKIYNLYWDGDSWEQSILNSGAPLAMDGIDICATTNNVYYVGDDGKIKNLYWNGSGWSYTTLVSGQPTVRTNSNLYFAEDKIYYISESNDKIYNLYQSGGTWYSSLLNNSAPSVRENSRFVADIGKVYYVAASDNKVYNYYYLGGGSWDYSILTSSSSQVLLNTGVEIESGKIYYTANDNKIRRQVWNGATSIWTEYLLDASQTLVDAGEQVYVKDGRVYFDHNGWLYYLERTAHSWDSFALAPCPAGPSSISTKLAASTIIPESDQKIYYVGSDRRIHSFYYVPCRLNIALDKSFDDDNEITLYPNPSSGEINILNNIGELNNCKILIFDLNGELIYTQTENSNIPLLGSIKLSVNLPKGVYLVKLISNDNSRTGKAIIQ